VDSALEHAIISLDLNRRITSWNVGAERIFGYPKEEAIGQLADLIFTDEDCRAGIPAREIRQAIAEGRANDNRWLQRKDGSRFWASGVALPMRDAGTGFVKILRDETEMYQARQALEKSQADLLQALQETEVARRDAEAAGHAKDQFLAVLSHELRTPLTPILMAVQSLLRRSDLPDHVRETMEMIGRNVRIEAGFIDDLLDITRISRGKMELNAQELDLHDVVTHAIEVSRGDIEAKQQQLTIELKAQQHCLRGDFTRLQQVIWNLLKNASKFTPKGGAIHLATSNDNDRFVLRITDTGIGIEHDALVKIFESFTQGSENIAREFGGLGLGLAISKATVEAHRGSLEAHSDGHNKGAIFTVSLPLN